MIVSIHIPKTGGTSFRRLLEQRHGRRFAAYYGPQDRNTDARLKGVEQEDLAAALRRLSGEVDIVHGHLRASALADAIESPAKVWVWLRDPVERVISNYFYLKQSGSERRAARLRSGEVDLLAFAEQRRNADLQSQFLRPLAIEELGFVGLTERYDDCLRLLPGAEAPLRAAQRNRTREKPSVEPEIRARLAELNAADVALYGHARALVERRLAGLPPPDRTAEVPASALGRLKALFGR